MMEGVVLWKALGAIGVLGAVYLCAILIDIFLVKRGARRQVTTPGKIIARMVLHKARRIQQLELQIHKFERTETRKLLADEGEQEEASQEPMLELFSKLKDEISSDAYCLLWLEDDAVSHLQAGIDTDRMARVYTSRYLRYFLAEERIQAQIVSEREFGADINLCSMGIEHSVVLPIRLPFGDVQRALICIAYSERPYEVEAKRLMANIDKIVEGYHTEHELHKMDRMLKTREKESKANSSFITQLGHDLRSPLSNIRALLTYLNTSCTLEPGVRSLIEGSLENCDNLAELICDVIDYTRFQEGSMVANKSEFTINSLISGIAAAHMVAAQAKGIELEAEIKTDVQLRADKKQIKRVLNNLVSNAIKYTDEGCCFIRSKIAEDGSFIIAVGDTGTGMTQEQVQRLFNPYERFHAGKVDGIGLGMTICKILADVNGCEIRVDSTPGMGTRVDLVFKPEAVLEVQEQKAIREQAKVKRTILLVDDDEKLVRTFAVYFSKRGIKIDTARTVSEATNYMHIKKPDIVITDANLGIGGGEKVLAHFQSVNPHGVSYVMSGNDNHETKKMFENIRVDRWITKPAELNDLYELLVSSHSDKILASAA